MAPVPWGIAPMKAASGPLPPATDEGWVYEVKWDGFRTLVFVDGGRVRLQSSNRLDVTTRWPDLAEVGPAVHAESAVLDGEVVALLDDGRPSFGALVRGEGPVMFMAFDLLALNGHDTTGLPLEQRRHLLTEVLEPGDRWALSPQYDDGEALARATEAQGLEGVMAKRRGSPYVAGKRSPTWRKVKHRRRQEFVVGGWSPGEGNRSTSFGSLALGVYEGGRLRFAGAVGTGFDARTLTSLQQLLAERPVDACPFDPPPPKAALRRPRWVRPDLVAEVEFAEWTHDGIVRHSSFQGLRDDKDPHEVVREP
jgi:bifunctional non-homologous end joining protein LigD